MLGGKAASWKEVDEHVRKQLQAAAGDQRQIVFLSGTITSPSLRALIAKFGARFRNFHHVSYDAVSASAIAAANKECFGRAVVPHYAFDKAKVIVGLEADFLGTWLSPVEFAQQYVAGRRAGGERPRHVQFESGLSVTGSNADRRVAVAPSDIGAVAAALLRRISAKAGRVAAPAGSEEGLDTKEIDAVADALWAHRGASLVVSGRNDRALQVVVATLNGL